MNSSFITAELVEKAKKGDRSALEQLLVQSTDLIKHTVFNFRLGADSEDALQDIWIKIMKELPHLRNSQGYPKWLMTLAENHCIDILKRKKIVLLKEDLPDIQKEDIEIDPAESAERSLLNKERIKRMAGVLDERELQILKLRHVDGMTLEELASLDNLKKTSTDEKIAIASARSVLQEANQDWQESNFGDSRRKLFLITSSIKPTDASREKRFLLASALTRLGDIFQVNGQILGLDKSIDFYLCAGRIWDGLRNRTMSAYTVHMIALDNNISGNLSHALKILEQARNGYKKDSASRKIGDLERDVGSIFIKLGEYKSAERHIEKSIELLGQDNEESLFAALRKRGELETRRGQFDKAYDSLQDSVKDSPPYRALNHIQFQIALIDLFFSANEGDFALQYIEGAKRKCLQYGFLGQLAKLREIIDRHSEISLN